MKPQGNKNLTNFELKFNDLKAKNEAMARAHLEQLDRLKSEHKREIHILENNHKQSIQILQSKLEKKEEIEGSKSLDFCIRDFKLKVKNVQEQLKSEADRLPTLECLREAWSTFDSLSSNLKTVTESASNMENDLLETSN